MRVGAGELPVGWRTGRQVAPRAAAAVARTVKGWPYGSRLRADQRASCFFDAAPTNVVRLLLCRTWNLCAVPLDLDASASTLDGVACVLPPAHRASCALHLRLVRASGAAGSVPSHRCCLAPTPAMRPSRDFGHVRDCAHRPLALAHISSAGDATRGGPARGGANKRRTEAIALAHQARDGRHRRALPPVFRPCAERSYCADQAVDLPPLSVHARWNAAEPYVPRRTHGVLHGSLRPESTRPPATTLRARRDKIPILSLYARWST
ncbi:hypothetical protein AURDEDRAFT_171143 [Auricularia subglabra TFB-10046 SS5]|uniref:Uncharacterized protein n=1 Tax=Auricularia subglabra (strain TFB-10046 / SS5) TaxID=717982 RepID=J0DC77_AURST|nr:hypothetical protein AURDEDRAFT_171143 [Auricularia subglabra TFB-10046 SS5]